MRRILITLSTMVAAAVAMASSVPAAFAVQVAPPAGGVATTSRVAAAVHGHGGLAGWEVAIIIAAATAGALLMVSLLLTWSHRRVLHPTAA